MEAWVLKALKRWPNVPALYGWLTLDRRGRWLIKGEAISRPQIVDVIDRNYDSDERGCWFFQNGPQRGYVRLERAPFIVHVQSNAGLQTHNRLPVSKVEQVFLDEEGGLYLFTEHGPAALLDADLEWAVTRMFVGGRRIDENQIAAALTLPSGEMTEATLRLDNAELPIVRLDNEYAAAQLRFVRDPQPQEP